MFSVLFPVLISSIQRGNKGRKVTDLGGKFSATHKIEEMGEKKKKCNPPTTTSHSTHHWRSAFQLLLLANIIADVLVLPYMSAN